MILFIFVFFISQAIYWILVPFKQYSHRVRNALRFFTLDSAYRTIFIIFFSEAYMDLLLGGLVNTENEEYMYMDGMWGPYGSLTKSD